MARFGHIHRLWRNIIPFAPVATSASSEQGSPSQTDPSILNGHSRASNQDQNAAVLRSLGTPGAKLDHPQTLDPRPQIPDPRHGTPDTGPGTSISGTGRGAGKLLQRRDHDCVWYGMVSPSIFILSGFMGVRTFLFWRTTGRYESHGGIWPWNWPS